MQSSLVVKPLLPETLQQKSERIFTRLVQEALPDIKKGALKIGLENALGVMMKENSEGYKSRIANGICGGADLMMLLDIVVRRHEGPWTRSVARTLANVLERGSKVEGFMKAPLPADRTGDWLSFCVAEDNFASIDRRTAVKYLSEASDGVRSLMTRYKASIDGPFNQEIIDELTLVRCGALFSTMAPNIGQFHNSASAWSTFNYILANPQNARIGSIEEEQSASLASLHMQLSQLALAIKTSNR